MRRHAWIARLLLVLGLAPQITIAQDANIPFPAKRVETLLRDSAMKPLVSEGSRYKGDRTEHVLLSFGDSTVFEVKWAVSARGGEAFNNQPRYEVAAYELQKLFLDEKDYVVPPTALRMILPEVFGATGLKGEPTFDGSPAVLVALQYWTMEVTGDNVFDKKRADRDTVYARHLGDLNILTYLIRHRDANKGNVLMSTDSTNPRMFSVDNGVAFSSPPSDRGTDWQNMRVKRVSAATVARLRAITEAQLTQSLAIVANFERQGDGWVATPASANLDAGKGVRRNATAVQLGLTSYEIQGVRDRLRELLKEIDKGKIRGF